ncbi:hypothetical protein E3N88_44161 [Mikania micrantha]|uniref:Uncharacterized protein n=1 Tax=Mikania micrantha TaxID=192012 RepID=A0A5N6LCU8_9ASTR|nr:hypothetical protein E3N88_44161 [Mikania micrantha]
MADDVVVNSIPANPTTLTMVTFPSSLKLTSSNYLSWKTQIEVFLQGLDLFKYINGSLLAPPSSHADYKRWFRQDMLLFGALVSSISPTIVPLVSNAPSSYDAWTILANTYASTTRGHLKQLQHRLKNTTKTPDISISEYMQQIKILVDELANLGKLMDIEDVTDIILSGLDQKTYKPIIESVHARDTPIQFHELHEKLINHELSIAQQHNPTPSPIHQPITAFTSNTRSPHKPWNPRKNTPSNGLLPTPHTSPNPSPKPFLGRCQWCFTQGHSLTSCPTFKKAHPNITLPAYPCNTPSHKPQLHMASPEAVANLIKDFIQNHSNLAVFSKQEENVLVPQLE